MMSVVSDSDILRIKSALLQPQNGATTTKVTGGQGQTIPTNASASARELKKKQSDRRVEGWKDTLAAKRKERLLWKAKKEQEEEDRRQAIDREEAILRAQQRDKTIQRANALLYEGNDKVKVLRSQQLYTDVIADREDQIREKQAMGDAAQLEEAKWHESTMDKIKRTEQEEAKKALARRQKAIKVGEELRQQRLAAQAEQSKLLQKKQLEETAIIEGIKLADKEEKDRIIQQGRERRLKAKAEIAQIALDAKENRARRIQQEKEETRIREQQMSSMIKVANARTALEKKHFEDRQALRKVLSDTASKVLEERAASELERFIKQQQALNDKEDERLEQEARAKKNMQESIDQSRQEQMRKRQKDKEDEERANASFIEHFKETNAKQLKMERLENEEKRRRNMEIRRLQEEQIEKDRLRREQEQKERLTYENQQLQNLTKEDDVFREFAMKEIERYRAHGKKTSLLERTLNT